MVRHASYLAKHPTTRRVVIVVCLIFFLGSIGLTGPAFAANFTQTVTSKTDWELGTLTSVDTNANLDKIQLEDDGAWGAYSWAEPFDTIESGSSFASDGTYIYAARGGSFPWFWRYNPTLNTWNRLSDAIYPFGIGSDMRFVGPDTIYATSGLYSTKFAKYTISTNTWTELSSTPDVVGNGGALTYDGTNLYLLRGNTSQDFYRYTIGTNSWTPLTGVPATISNGADLVAGENGYLYAFRGSNTLTFYRYDINAGTWSDPAAADLPSGALMNADGNAVLVDGYIYKARSAGQRTWYRYSIAGNTWAQLTDSALTINYGGLIYVSGIDRIYSFRGLSTRMFWAWNPNTSAWIGAEEPNISGTAYTNGTGANLISDGTQYVYYLRGGNTNGLLRYDTSANTWTTRTNATANFNTDTYGVKAGEFLYFLQSSTTVLRYSIAGNSWSTMATLPAAVGNGGGLVYPGTGDFIYALRGAGTASFYRYSIAGNSWDDVSVADLPSTAQSTVANIGGRMISDGTNIFALIGNGSSRFLQYTIGTDTWSEVTSAPFAAYYGTALEYRSGKIYALAGYYKSDFYEYTVATNTWRRLDDTQVTHTAEAGAYNGASLAALGSTIYAIRGGAVLANTDFWTYTVSSNNYVANGTYISPVYDFTYVSAWVSLANNKTTPGDSSITIETRSSADNSSWSGYQALSGTSIQSPTNRYFQVRITLNSTTDRAQTPNVADFTITYTSDETAPTNPSATTGLSQEVGGVSITSGQSYSHVTPYFSWTGAADAQSGLQGYYVYFGTNESADPATAGSFTGNAFYKVNTAMSTGSYYLRIKAVDNKDNVAGTAWAAFTYVYNGVSPSQSLEITSQAQFETGTLTSTNATQSADALQLTSAAGAWKEDSLSPPPAAIFYGGLFAYVSTSNTLYTFRGNNTTTFYSYDVAANTWATETVSPVNIHLGGGVVEGPAGYLYGWAGNNSSVFMRYTIATQTWDDSAAADLPLGVTYGTAVKYDGSRYIYFLRGSNDDAFWKYDTQTNEWATLANAEFGNGLNQNIYIDSGMSYDGDDTIYILQGNNYSNIAKYTISTNTWTPLKPAPMGFYNGSTLSYDSATNSLYALAGNNRGAFLKYSIGSDSWSTLSEPPLPQSYGAAQRLIGRNIYTLRGGNTTSFWKYNIDTGLWTKPITNIFGPKYAGTVYLPFSNGGSIVKGDGDNLYAARGLGDNLFVRYNRVTGEVTHMAPVPHGMNTGSALSYDLDANEIYATTGITRNFYKYSVANNSWTEMSQDLLPNNVSDGSELVYYNGYVYVSRVNGAQFWRYDVDGVAGSRWSQLTSSTAAPGAGGSMVRNGNYIYMARGANTTSFYRYDINAGTWSTLTSVPANITTGGFIADGDNGYIYASAGTTSPGNRWYRYDINGDTWSQINNAPAAWGAGADGAGKNGEQIVAFLAAGTNAISDGLYTFTQQTSTSGFATSGTYLSASHNLSSVYKWANISLTYTTPANTTVTVKTQTSSDNSEWTSLTEATNKQRLTGTDTYLYQIASTANPYIRVEITMTSDGLYTPTVSSYTINYYQDSTAPTNPSTISGYSSSAQSTNLTTNNWYAYATPEFVWGAGTDNAGGSGLEGYYVYYGTDSNADPTITSGIINAQSAVQFQAGTTLTLASAMTTGQTYYLRVKARDLAQNTAATAYAAFIYKYDTTAPTAPGSLSASPAGFSATNIYTFSWSASADSNSGLLKYQYRTGGDEDDTWTDMNPATNTSVILPNDDHAEGKYQSGTNVFYIRAVDNAGNVSTSNSTNYYFAGSAPTPPQNVAVDPASSATNAFTVTWNAPAVFSGAANDITYLWSVNSLPTADNVTSTPATSVGPAALATQQGTNTFYVVAKDVAGNVDYSLYGSASFTATTSAPSAPNQFTLNDLSDRDSQQYGAAISWTVPTTFDSGNFAGYKVYRSEDGATFTSIASTTGTAYVDQGLTGGSKYYYKVTAYTKTNVESVATTSLNVTPTGKFTAPPTISESSIASTIYARRITFDWITTRAKGDGSGTSFVKCGLTVDDLNVTAGDFNQVLVHKVSVEGLIPSTEYQCFLYSIDVDGNTATHGPLAIITAAPPVVGDLQVTDATLTKARVSFTTNVQAKGKLKYGETSAFGLVKEFTSFGTSFSVELSDLKHSTTYYYGFEMTTTDGDVFAQEVINKFDTLPLPVVSNVTVEPVLNVDTPTIQVAYTTNVDTTSTVLYSVAGGKVGEASTSDPLSTTHKVTIAGLQPLKDYTLVVTGRDAFGNSAVGQTVYVTTKDDTKPPEVISFVTESRPQTDGKTIIIVKVVSNEPTTAVMEVAPGAAATSFSITGLEDPLNHNHTLSLSVNSGSVYSVRVKLVDTAGNVTYTQPENVSGGVRKPTATQIISRTLTKNFAWILNIWK